MRTKRTFFITKNYLLNWWKMQYAFCSYLCTKNPIDSPKKRKLWDVHMFTRHTCINWEMKTHILSLFLKFLFWPTIMHVPRMSLDIQRTLLAVHIWKVQGQELTLRLFPLRLHSLHPLAFKDIYKKRLRSKIWSPYECGSNDVSKKLKNPFQNTFGNRKPSYYAESNSMTFSFMQ